MCLALIPISLAVFKSRQLDLLYTRMFSGQTVAAQNEKQREKDEKAYLHSGLGRCNDAENKLIPRARYFLPRCGHWTRECFVNVPQGGAHGKDISKKLICPLVASDANRKEKNVQKLICQLATRDANGKENVDKKQQQKTGVSACYERGEREGEKCKNRSVNW